MSNVFLKDHVVVRKIAIWRPLNSLQIEIRGVQLVNNKLFLDPH